MCEGLSREEFLILQEQLLELKNKNYELHEELKKKNTLLETQNHGPKNEALQFASKLINRSKDKDVQKLETEVATLRRKLDTQEDEFRLQQQTLIQEMNEFSTKNQELTEKLTTLKEGSGVPTELNSLKTQNAELTMKIEQMTEQVVSLTEAQTEFRNSDKATQSIIDSKDGMITALENQMLEFAAKLENMNTVDKEQKQKMTESEQQLDLLTKEMDSHSELITQFENKVKQLEEVKAASEITVRELQDLKEVLEKKKKALDSMENERDQTRRELDEAKKELLESQQKASELSQKLQTSLEETEMEQQKRIEAERRLQQTVTQQETAMKQLEGSITQRMKDEKDNHHKEIEQLQTKLREVTSSDEQRLEEQLMLQENRFQLELNGREKQFLMEKDELLQKITKLEETLAGKDDEKNIALKKQSALVKELQRAVKEERKRADSEERSREKEGWHMVESDQRSSNTFDGNDSVSSLSVLETDNAELISRLTTMQRLYADTVDRLSQVENEAARLNREVHEKNELIEHWIRNRPLTCMGSNSNSPSPRQDGMFRKLLASTLATEDANSDIKEMNKKLQRMLEETLSKNILLQRDLQTLLERTEM